MYERWSSTTAEEHLSQSLQSNNVTSLLYTEDLPSQNRNKVLLRISTTLKQQLEQPLPQKNNGTFQSHKPPQETPN